MKKTLLIKILKERSGGIRYKFCEKMIRNFRENQNLFYGATKQLRRENEHNSMNIKDKEEIIER